MAGSLNDARSANIVLLSGFDLLASTEQPAFFLCQISGERFRDDDFLAEGVRSYTKFLKLKPKAGNSQTVLVPTYQIDLMWHTHILSSISEYIKDCIAIMGQTLHQHDDLLTHRSEGGILDVAFKATARLWKEEYNSKYVVCGSMYRGEPLHAFFLRIGNAGKTLVLGRICIWLAWWEHHPHSLGPNGRSPQNVRRTGGRPLFRRLPPARPS